MSEPAQLYGVHIIRFTCTTRNLNAGESVTNDINGDPMRLPRGFVIDDGYVHGTAGSTPSGSIDVGFEGGDEDTFLSDFTLSDSGGGAITRIGLTNVSNAPTGVGAPNSGDVGNTLIVTQKLSNEDDTAPTITITLMGHYEF